jgi:hypothetical protein
VVHPLGKAYFGRRYTILFYVLVFTVVAAPLAAAVGLSGDLIELLLAISLVAAVMPVKAGKGRYFLLATLAGLWLARPLMASLGYPKLSQLILSVWTLIGLFAAAVALRFAMRGAKVEAEHLFAALSSYLLAGMYFGLLFWTLEQFHPGSLSVSNLSRTGAIYYSFVTLATIGYGDIVPRTDVARGLAVVEGIGGQLFLAVLVARLLSLYSGRRGNDGTTESDSAKSEK